MSAMPGCTDLSTERESTAVFSGSIEFANEMGFVSLKLQEALTHEDLELEFHDAMNEARGSIETIITSWHDYLRVGELHSSGCLRAAFSTITALVKLFAKVCEIGEGAQHRHPMLWTADIQDDLTHALERLEDIQESLAVLIDDEAREDLRAVLRDAGIENKMLDREDERPRKVRPHQD